MNAELRVGRKGTKCGDWSGEVMLQRCDMDPITLKGDGRMERSGEEKGYMPN